MTGNAPSAARLRHAEAIDAPRIDALAFRQGWRVVTRLDGLLAAGLIAPGVWQAGAEYRAAWEALRRTSTGGGSSLRDGSGAGAGRIGALDRAARIRAAESAISPGHAALCHACCVEDLSWRSLGVRLGVRDVTAQAWTAHALIALARAWRRGGTGLGTGSHSAATALAVQTPSKAPRWGVRWT
jgi:hypothetical protein